ncbi:MAG: YceD family protein [Steroidobacterales bacterium]
MVDCERLAAERGTLERTYELGQLPRLQDLLADRRGRLRAEFGFRKAPSGRSAAVVAIEATPWLVCQRCLEAFEFPVCTRGEVEFTAEAQADEPGSLAEVYRSDQGLVSLRELAEEELLLALPLVPACSSTGECGKAQAFGGLEDAAPVARESVRPFAALQDLMKKQDRT